MDSLTHIVLGACAGQLIAGKQLGKKAMVLGALAQSIPDFDFIASFFLETSRDLLAHRGLTHSWLFVLILTPILTWISVVLQRRPLPGAGKWALLWGGEMAIHLLLDACNAYGTAWWFPFSRERVAFHLLFVADPLFSLWPLIVAIILFFAKPTARWRNTLAIMAIALSLTYTGVSGVHKHGIDRDMKAAADRQQIDIKRYFSTPTAFNNLLWFVVVESDSGFYIGHRSIMDRRPPDSFRYFPRNEQLLSEVVNQREVENLKEFSNNYFVVTRQSADTIVFHDLRFGQMNGWLDPHSPFVFYYYFDRPDANQLVVQRGRFSRWNMDIVRLFLERMCGGNPRIPESSH